MCFKKILGPAALSACLFITAQTQVFAAPRDVSHSTNTELRLEYLSKLLNSRSGQRLAQHNNGKTKIKINQMLLQANTAISAGNEKKANDISKQAVKLFMSAVRDLPEDPEEIARFKMRYEDMRSGLEKFGAAQEENKRRFAREKNNAKEYSKEQVNKLLELADQDASNADYEKAVTRLAEAQSIITSSLQGILNNKKLVIELDISTPEKEYAYEVRRYQGYEDLIEVAIDVKKPSEMVQKSMLKLGDKAKWMSEQAHNKANEENYPIAIRMMMDATNVIRQALRIAGVTM